MILIVSTKADLHALTMARALQRRAHHRCCVVECDRLSAEYHISWTLTPGHPPKGMIRLQDGSYVSLDEVSVVWWRRPRADQLSSGRTASEAHSRLIDNDCRGGLAGLLSTTVNGVWVSTPEATDRASNKPYQLQVAARCGFRVPCTLMSQSRSEVIAFQQTLDTPLIVKPVVGTAGALLFTQYLDKPDDLPEESFTVAPALYQEYIPGTEHIRLNCFGDASYAASIRTDALDWRHNLNVPVETFHVPPTLHALVRRVLDELGLAMGIVDLKCSPEGEFVWLEVNPQGQFLFLQGLTGAPLVDYFADYLSALAEHGKGAELGCSTTSQT